MLNFTVNTDRCTGCALCVSNCPLAVLEMDGDRPRVRDGREGLCMECQQCLTICKPGAVSIFSIDPDDCLPLRESLPSPQSMEALVKGRRSIRKYKADPLDPETLDWLVDSASHAPTAKNNRDLLLTVIEDPAVMQAIREETYEGIQRSVDAGTLPREFAFFRTALAAYGKGVDLIYRGAPHMIVATTPAAGPAPVPDGVIALSYFELLAASAGVGTVWCGFAKWMLTDVVPSMRARLDIPDDHTVTYAMMFGRPAVRFHRGCRRPGKVKRLSALR